MNEEQAENHLHHENVYTNNLGGRQRPQKRARFVTYGEQVDLVRNTPRAAALGMRTVPGTWQSYPVVRSQRVCLPAANVAPSEINIHGAAIYLPLRSSEE